MKRIRACAIAVIMLITLCVPTQAAEKHHKVTRAECPAELAIAYSEIDESTTEAEREQILEARSEIIYSHSWVADGLSACILDENGNVKEILPQFSEIFPEDWEEPMEKTTIEVQNDAVAPMSTKYDWHPYYDGSVYLKVPTTTDTTPFCQFTTTAFSGTYNEYRVVEVTTQGIRNNPAEVGKFNVGYSNVKTKKSLGYAVDLNNCEYLSINPPANITLGVRVSSYDYPGDWHISVNGKRVFPNKS